MLHWILLEQFGSVQNVSFSAFLKAYEIVIFWEKVGFICYQI